jgi:hypothetical protein
MEGRWFASVRSGRVAEAPALFRVVSIKASLRSFCSGRLHHGFMTRLTFLSLVIPALFTFGCEKPGMEPAEYCQRIREAGADTGKLCISNAEHYRSETPDEWVCKSACVEKGGDWDEDMSPCFRLCDSVGK